jgi:hypothetical protein
MGPRSETLLREVLDIEADNAEARRLLGYVQHDGRWVTPEDRNRQIGLVEFEGQWHKPESVAAIKEARAEAVRAVEERETEPRTDPGGPAPKEGVPPADEL